MTAEGRRIIALGVRRSNLHRELETIIKRARYLQVTVDMIDSASGPESRMVPVGRQQ